MADVWSFTVGVWRDRESGLDKVKYWFRFGAWATYTLNCRGVQINRVAQGCEGITYRQD